MTTANWGPVKLAGRQCVHWRVGAVTMWARAFDDEWEIAHSYDDRDTDREECPEDVSWTRFVTVANDDLFTQPALPDRPVVIRPQSPIVILPGRWGRFYFSVPLWVRFVSQPAGRSATMEEIPSQNLSSTWFGDMATGELCYAIDSRLLRRQPTMDANDAFARCEIEVRNGSRERLQFERISVHVEHMHLFETADKFWTNQLRVVFKGADQVSQLTFLPNPPAVAGEAKVVCEPRIPLEKNILKRSFNLIREITGI
jgi:hypothetical protein